MKKKKKKKLEDFIHYLICFFQRLWMDGSFEDLDAETVETTTDEFYKEISKMQKTYKSKIKQQIQENAPRKFKGE